MLHIDIGCRHLCLSVDVLMLLLATLEGVEPDAKLQPYLQGTLCKRKDFIEADDAAKSHPNRTYYYRKDPDLERLIELCSQGLDHKPRPELLMIRAAAHMKRKEYQKAVTDFTTFLEHCPSHISALLQRGTAYDGLGLLDRAIKDYTAVLELSSNHFQAAYARAACHNRKGSFALSIADYQAALSMDQVASAALQRPRRSATRVQRFKSPQALEEYLREAVKGQLQWPGAPTPPCEPCPRAHVNAVEGLPPSESSRRPQGKPQLTISVGRVTSPECTPIKGANMLPLEPLSSPTSGHSLASLNTSVTSDVIPMSPTVAMNTFAVRHGPVAAPQPPPWAGPHQATSIPPLAPRRPLPLYPQPNGSHSGLSQLSAPQVLQPQEPPGSLSASSSSVSSSAELAMSAVSCAGPSPNHSSFDDVVCPQPSVSLATFLCFPPASGASRAVERRVKWDVALVSRNGAFFPPGNHQRHQTKDKEEGGVGERRMKGWMKGGSDGGRQAGRVGGKEGEKR